MVSGHYHRPSIPHQKDRAEHAIPVSWTSGQMLIQPSPRNGKRHSLLVNTTHWDACYVPFAAQPGPAVEAVRKQAIGIFLAVPGWTWLGARLEIPGPPSELFVFPC